MYELLKILADGEFHSGAKLGKQLGITRAGVWKRIKKIEERAGIEIISAQGKGYRLQHPLELLNEACLLQKLPTTVGLHLFQKLDSTNDFAKSHLKNSKRNELVIAEEQLKGKGRRGRSWASPYGGNLYMSLVWPVTEGVRQLSGLSLAVGLAICEVLEELGVESAQLKWPNDVLVNNRKIAGVLIELVGDLSDDACAIIGIGLNVNMLNSPADINQPWTSMAIQLGHSVSRNEVLVRLYTHLEKILCQVREKGFGSLRGQWEQKQAWRGETVVISTSSSQSTGVLQGVNDQGELGVLMEQGLQFFAGGELSLRKLHDS